MVASKFHFAVLLQNPDPRTAFHYKETANRKCDDCTKEVLADFPTEFRITVNQKKSASYL